jgi:hypothetical protein
MSEDTQCVATTQKKSRCTHYGLYFEGYCKMHQNMKLKTDAEYKARYDARPHQGAIPILRHEHPAPAPARARSISPPPPPPPPPPPAPAPAPALAPASRLITLEPVYTETAAKRRDENIGKNKKLIESLSHPTPEHLILYSVKFIHIWDKYHIPGFECPRAYAILRHVAVRTTREIEDRDKLFKAVLSLYLLSEGNHPEYISYISIPSARREDALQQITNALLPFTKLEDDRMIPSLGIIPKTDAWVKIIRRRYIEETRRLQEEARRIAEEERKRLEEAAAALAAEAAERRRQLQEDLLRRPVVFKRDPDGGVDLAALGADPQSVHRSSVQNTTQKALPKLMTRCLEEGQETLLEIITDLTDTTKVRVSGTDTRERMITEITNDYFECIAFSVPYGDVLDRVWAFIRSHKYRSDMFIRLAQEIAEGMGMCTNGKMARLINVLQGYDDTLEIDPPKEVFQEKIALLMKRPAEDRAEAARALFIEFSIPEAEQAPWLESLED